MNIPWLDITRGMGRAGVPLRGGLGAAPQRLTAETRRRAADARPLAPPQGRDRTTQAGVPIPVDGAGAASEPISALPPGALPFADSGNPILSQVAFLSAIVGPKVAAAAAQAALDALCAEIPVVDADVRPKHPPPLAAAFAYPVASPCHFAN